MIPCRTESVHFFVFMNSAAKVRESSTQTIAVSVPRLDEEVKQKRADRYRLLVARLGGAIGLCRL